MANYKEYLEFGGKEFYINFNKLTDLVVIKDETKDDEEEMTNTIHIDVTKYETIREMIATVIDTNAEIDDKMGIVGLNSLPISFKIAYNTLIHYNILDEVE